MSEDMNTAPWEPISEAKLLEMVTSEASFLEAPLRTFWDRVRIEPVKWSLPPWGDQGAGFWVVAIVEQRALWYNDIEDGFNVSRFDAAGRINDYCCNQDDLGLALRRLSVDI